MEYEFPWKNYGAQLTPNYVQKKAKLLPSLLFVISGYLIACLQLATHFHVSKAKLFRIHVDTQTFRLGWGVRIAHWLDWIREQHHYGNVNTAAGFWYSVDSL